MFVQSTGRAAERRRASGPAVRAGRDLERCPRRPRRAGAPSRARRGRPARRGRRRRVVDADAVVVDLEHDPIRLAGQERRRSRSGRACLTALTDELLRNGKQERERRVVVADGAVHGSARRFARPGTGRPLRAATPRSRSSRTATGMERRDDRARLGKRRVDVVGDLRSDSSPRRRPGESRPAAASGRRGATPRGGRVRAPRRRGPPTGAARGRTPAARPRRRARPTRGGAPRGRRRS